MRKRVLQSAVILASSTFASMATVSAFAADLPSISPSSIYSGHWLLGVETDLTAVHLNGSANGGPTPYAVSPPVNIFGQPDRFFINSYANADWLFTFRPRVGFVQNNWLLYATGGLALTSLHGDFTFTDGNSASDSANIQQSRAPTRCRQGTPSEPASKWD
jgi:outer membrane immunogenic protein